MNISITAVGTTILNIAVTDVCNIVQGPLREE
jgi:hypothetical protein